MKENGAYVVQDGRESIDLWQYCIVILELFFILFTLECNWKQILMGLLPIIIEENKVPSHNSRY